MSKTAKRKRKRIVLTAEQKRADRTKREHINFARSVFKQTGFTRFSAASGKEFTFNGFKSDFDDIFLNENIIAVVEYTTLNETGISTHLKKKYLLYQQIETDNEKFVDFLKSEFPAISSIIQSKYASHHFQVRIIYASRYQIREETKTQVPSLIYLDYAYLRYFERVATTVKLSARFELFEFLRIRPDQYGDRILAPSRAYSNSYEGSILPEAHSHFPRGFKVVSFYVDAEALLFRSYVLRRDGWKNSNVYQRMISRNKVEAIRKYLLEKKCVFVNNVIVTLPHSVKLLDHDGNTIDASSIKSTRPGTISLPVGFNSIGLIDGQHRVFSYHEGGIRESEMEVLRKQQNLLVTGIIFPKNYTEIERTRFEARLFLDINANQTNAKSDLKQEIGLLLDPYTPDSIARRVVVKLNETGPLNNLFERHFFDKGKLKTTTVVSYGLKPLVRLGGDESLFKTWSNPNKDDLRHSPSDAVLSEYIDFVVHQINHFLAGVRSNLDKSHWMQKEKNGTGILNTTIINGLIFCLRKLVKEGRTDTYEGYHSSLRGVSGFEFSSYKSSQYNQMGEALYGRFFDT